MDMQATASGFVQRALPAFDLVSNTGKQRFGMSVNVQMLDIPAQNEISAWYQATTSFQFSLLWFKFHNLPCHAEKLSSPFHHS